MRRIPFWGRYTEQRLERHRVALLRRAGIAPRNHRGQAGARRSRYRYPENPRGVGLTTVLRGPEAVYRVRLTRRVANFGVVDHTAGARKPRRAARRRRTRREPAHRATPGFRSTTTRTSRASGSAGSRGGRALAAPRRLLPRLRQRGARGRRTLHLPALDRRRDAARASAPDEVGAGGHRAPHRRDRRRLGRLPAVDPRPRSTATACPRPSGTASSGSRPPGSPPAATASGFASPTTRRRRTPRTSPASSRTRGS